MYEETIKMEDYDNLPRVFSEDETLWFDVLTEAVKNLSLPTNHIDCSFKWFMSDRKTIGSFLWACHVTDMEPDFIIRGVARRLYHHMKII
jgi:hypothetical protein